jgi:hypothetical protein
LVAAGTIAKQVLLASDEVGQSEAEDRMTQEDVDIGNKVILLNLGPSRQP